MSHNVGTVQTVSPVFKIGPGTNVPPSPAKTWSASFAPVEAPTGTKFVILHFTGVSLPANNRLEVDLGYETDVFTSADGGDFWSRPVNIYSLPGGLIPIRYITDGATTGIATIDRYGRGERRPGIQDPTSLSNCDPFLKDPAYLEPKYDPFWYCADPPNWENAACVTGDIRAATSPSVGMILHIEDASSISTCSVTLIGPDRAICAGHCIPDDHTLVASSSVIFGYQVNCDGSRPAGYAPRVCKVLRTVNWRHDSSFDYWIVQLKVPPGGLGLPVIQLRHDLPALGENVFGLHHPNGAVKKVSVPHPGFATVVGSSATGILVTRNVHVSGGSSGSGLFDAAGRITGMLANGDPCHGGNLSYFPTATMLLDIAPAPPPSVSRDVVIVFDRSGSMSTAGASGRPKIQEAHDAASLFVQLVRAGGGNRLGLVSFATTASSPVDFPIAPVTAGNQTALVGPAPFVGGVIGNLVPGGTTTIGGGLDAARQQFPNPGANPRSILLLTDGMQNTPPMIADVEGGLGDISLDAIGYGTPANLDGALLSSLATAHGGQYAQGDTNLQLEKFFTQAFGNIFEAGLLMDPEFDLAANQDAAPIPFDVCEEERVTVVLGWDNAQTFLRLEVQTPLGGIVSGSTLGVEQVSGETWTFLRIPLPQASARDGMWHVKVMRPAGRGEFPPQTPALRFFVNVVASGGAIIRRRPDRKTYYTGDAYNPRIELRYLAGGVPPNPTLDVTVKRPAASIGTILSKARLRPPVMIGGDVITARQATLAALQTEANRDLIGATEVTFDLDDSPANNDGEFESGGNFGRLRTDLLTVDGEYSLRVRAAYGEGCKSTREHAWGLHVEVGIDPKHTPTTITTKGTGPGGRTTGTITIIPGGGFGNQLGPGRGDALSTVGGADTTVDGTVIDNGDGSYTVPISWLPGSDPGILVGQPNRPPVAVQTGPSQGGSPAGGCGSTFLAGLLGFVIGLLIGFALGRLL